MLVTTRELIDNAVEKHIGVGAFNVTTLSMLQGIAVLADEPPGKLLI